jgi:hypothetical protein
LWGDKKCFNYGDNRKKEKRSRVLLASSLLLFHRASDGKRRSEKREQVFFEGKLRERRAIVCPPLCVLRAASRIHNVADHFAASHGESMSERVKKWVTTRRRCDNHAGRGKHACFAQPAIQAESLRAFFCE